MGVDIHAINRMTRVDGHADSAEEIVLCDPFQRRGAGLEALLGPPENDGWWVTGTRCEASWSSAYSTYNRMRGYLAQLAHGESQEALWERPDVDQLDFGELISFSDCDGTIGPESSARIVAAFAKHKRSLQSKAHVACGGDLPRFIDFLDSMEAMFKHAANGGAVCFG